MLKIGVTAAINYIQNRFFEDNFNTLLPDLHDYQEGYQNHLKMLIVLLQENEISAIKARKLFGNKLSRKQPVFH